MADNPRERRSPAPLDQSTSGAGVAGAGRKRRRFSLLTRRDKLVLALMIGIPLLLDLALIWGTTIASVLLSFTNWNGIGGITGDNVIGLKNYENLFNAYPFFWPALTHNILWLAFLMFVATPIG
ncbi:MAG: hypothetical protein Q7S35_03170, partial [Candidatus Limnocylindrales bacterium]|nr:hypothetical protein [Candidatus Limnocylindrales bacterium]